MVFNPIPAGLLKSQDMPNSNEVLDNLFGICWGSKLVVLKINMTNATFLASS